MTNGNMQFWKAFDLLQAGDYVQASEIFESIGTDDAKHQLAYIYRVGLGGEPRIEDSICLYRYLADKGNMIAAYDLGSMLLSLNRPDEATIFLILASGHGNSSASYWLSQIYEGYKGAKIDAIQHIYYLKKSAQQGHLFAKRDILKNKYNLSHSILEKIKYKLLLSYVKWKSTKIILKNPNNEIIS